MDGALLLYSNGGTNEVSAPAFEEIENNLHPALQRRVFEYLYKYAVEHDVKMFITSHSHIAINMFYGRKKAKIFHVQKD